MRRETPAVVAMATLFVIAVLLAMLTSYILPKEYQVFGSDTASVENSLYLFGIVIVFTIIILAIAKWGKAKLIQIIILFSVGMSVFYVANAPLLVAGYGTVLIGGVIDLATLISAIIGFLVVLLLYTYPEWYIIDITGVILAAGVAAIFGISLEMSVVIIALIIFAIYDAISVYKTKHMVDLADNVMDLRLPVLLVIPKRLPYSFLKAKRLKLQIEDKTEREAMFMGLGDIVFPGMLVVSALKFLPLRTTMLGINGNILVALFTLVGCVVGFAVLMRFVLKGNPQAGLPLLNGGAIGGYIVSVLMIYGDLQLKVPTFG